MIVFVTDELPRPGTAGHLALNHAIITWAKAEGLRPKILLTGARQAWPIQRYAAAAVAGPHVRQLGPYLIVTSPAHMLRQLARLVLACLPTGLKTKLRRARHQADAVLGSFPSPADLHWCARAVARLAPKSVLIDTIFRAPLLAEPELAGVHSIIIAHDLFHRRAKALQAAGYAVQPQAFTRTREARLLGRAHAIAAIQPEEADMIRAMCPARHIFVAPMPALPCQRPPGLERIPGRLVFVGSASLPNLDGLRWFLSDIWPKLANHNITLDIVGDCGQGLKRLPPGVKICGRVPELAPFLHRASLAISPLRAGSGLKIKLLDYARHGLFTVATPPSLAGFQADPEAPFIPAGSAAIFAKAVLRYAGSPPPPGAAIAYCAQHYGLAASFAGLRAALERPDSLAAEHLPL